VLIDHRTYRLKVGTVQKHLDLYEKYGKVPQTRHLGQPLGYLITESGDLNTIVHMWVYEDAADRARKRAAMYADSEWQSYLKMSVEAGYIIEQSTRLMTPASFYPITR
jgi:hypothetical protein